MQIIFALSNGRLQSKIVLSQCQVKHWHETKYASGQSPGLLTCLQGVLCRCPAEGLRPASEQMLPARQDIPQRLRGRTEWGAPLHGAAAGRTWDSSLG